jgi:cob(I)alamin adenosyltransferase
MITASKTEIDALSEKIEMPKEFVVPGENQLSAALDVARTVIRRAERVAVAYALEDSLVVVYFNRLERPRVDDGPMGRGPASPHRVRRN